MADLCCKNANSRLPWSFLGQLGELCPCASPSLAWLDPGLPVMSSATRLLPLFSSSSALSPSIVCPCVGKMASCIASSVKRELLFPNLCPQNSWVDSHWPDMCHVPIFEPVTVAIGEWPMLIGQAWEVCPLLEREVGWVGAAGSAPPKLHRQRVRMAGHQRKTTGLLPGEGPGPYRGESHSPRVDTLGAEGLPPIEVMSVQPPYM